MDLTKHLKTLVNANNGGKKIPALSIIENSPLTAAIISKLHTNERTSEYDSSGNKKITTPSHMGLSDISADVAQKSTDNENILELFPELEEGLRILVNAVIAPKDLNSTEVNYSLPTNLKVSILSNKLIPIVEEVLSKDLKLKELLPDIIYETLGINGCYPMVVIPESSVDDLINDRTSISTESLTEHFGNNSSGKTKGFLGDAREIKKTTRSAFGFEDIINSGGAFKRSSMTDQRVITPKDNLDTLVRVTDNFEILKLPKIIELKRDQEVNKTLAMSEGSLFHGLEDINLNGYGSYANTNLNDIQLTQLLYKGNINIRNVTRKIKTSDETKRANIGAPLTKLLPAESVIPVVLSGDKKKHIAYFCLLDAVGNPLSKDSAATVYEDFRRNQVGYKKGGNLASNLIQRTADAFSTSCDVITYQQMQKICTEIIETDFLARLRNGIYGEDVALVNNTIFYDILLARMFKEQQTQVLFIPEQLLTYFHFNLRKNGTGKTLLESSLVLNTLRSVLLFSNVNRSVINSIGKTSVDVTLDENDPNKQKTLEVMKHEALKVRQSQALPATISPTDIQHYLQTANVYFNIQQVPGLPSTSLKFNAENMNYVKPDTDLMEELDKKAILALGVPPELVANSREVEFATNIFANHLRLSKQVSVIQEKFEPHLNKLARTYCSNHGTVVETVERVIKQNIKEITDVKDVDPLIVKLKEQPELLVKLLTREFLSNFEVSFSRPDTVSLKSQIEAFEEFEQAVDKIISYNMSDDILSATTSGEITAEQVTLVRNSIKAQLIRDFLLKNNILPEAMDIITTDSEGNQKLEIFTSISKHANNMTRGINEFLKRVVPIKEASDDDMNTLTGGQELGGAVSSSSSSGGSSSSDSGTSDSDGDTEEDNEAEDDGSGDMPDMPDFGSF